MEAIQAGGLPAVVTISPMSGEEMRDGRGIVDTCKELAERGADVTGMNCFRGPNTMMPHIRKIRAAVPGHIAALPITFRTTEEEQTFFSLKDEDPNCSCPSPHGRPFPTALDPKYVNRYEIRAFAEEAWALGGEILGRLLRGGAHPHSGSRRSNGRTPPASRYREDMDRHFLYGKHKRIKEHIAELAKRLDRGRSD